MVDITAATAELARRELARRALLPFVQRFHPNYDVGWFHNKLGTKLDQFAADIEAGKEPRLIVTVPPRHGKSTLVSEFLPAHLLGRHPEWDVIMATYNQNFADNLGRKVRDHLNDPRFLDLFTLKLDGNTNAADFVKTAKGGMYKSTGVGGSLTGLGAHALLIDDPIKDREEADSQLIRDRLWDWYTGVARTRLHPGGGVVVVHTRWHVDDLIGRLIKQMRADPEADQWEVIDFPAIAIEDEEFRKAGEALHPKRYPVRVLNKIRASLPARDWEALYQCRPFVADGGFFRKQHLNWYTELPKDLSYFIAADYATSAKATSDHTCVLAAGIDPRGHVWIHPGAIYERLDPLPAVRRTVLYAKGLKAHALTHEKGVIANTLEPLFRQEMQAANHFLVSEKYTRSSAKHIYANAIAGLMEAGRVHLPASCRAWMEPLILRFVPDADGEDDLIDALASVGMFAQKATARPHVPAPEEKDPELTLLEERSKVARESFTSVKREREGGLDSEDW